MAWAKKTISLDPQVWEDAKKVIMGEMNMSMSKFIEIQLRTLVRAHSKSPFMEVVQGAMRGFMEGDKSLTEKERRQMSSAINKVHNVRVKSVRKKK